MHIKKFGDYKKTNELYVHNKSKDLDDKYFILYQKDLWLFTKDEWISKKYYNVLNKAYGKRIASVDLYGTFNNIVEKYLDILSGKIINDIIYIELDNHTFRHSEHSDDLYKLKSELDMPIKLSFRSGINMDNEEELDINIEKKKIKNRTFYHGTSLNFLPQILKVGISPTKHTNYPKINHNNKIFITLNMEAAYSYAFHSAMKNGSFPIILEVKVPDIDKLIVDYDLGRDVYGDGSNIMRDLDYNKFNISYKVPGIDYKKDITNKIGIYGYLGRIPASHLQDVWIDMVTYADAQYIFNPVNGEFSSDADVWDEFNDVKNWSEVDKNDIMKRIHDIQDEFNDEFNEDED